MKKFFDKMERRLSRYAISNLMFYVIILNIGGFILCNSNPGFYYQYLQLSVRGILRGEVWRLVTFVLDPPAGSLISMFFFCMLYYTIGTALEQVWGAYRFNLYYFTGVILHIVAAFLVYFIFRIDLPINLSYLNMSLFLAFGAEFPDYELLIAFLFPIKVKWLAILDGIMLGISIIGGFMTLFVSPAVVGYGVSLVEATAAFVSLLNFFIYFFNNRRFARYSPKQVKRRAVYQAKVKKSEHAKDMAPYRHKCAICGRTEKMDPTLEFRYCSKCEGSYEYCMDHLYTHKHVMK